jgi:hypothetical protein
LNTRKKTTKQEVEIFQKSNKCVSKLFSNQKVAGAVSGSVASWDSLVHGHAEQSVHVGHIEHPIALLRKTKRSIQYPILRLGSSCVQVKITLQKKHSQEHLSL